MMSPSCNAGNVNMLRPPSTLTGMIAPVSKDVAFLKSIQPKSDDPTDMKIKYLQEFGAALKRKEEERCKEEHDCEEEQQ